MKMRKFGEVINKIEDLLFEPHACICCRRECDSDSSYRLCSRCQKVFPFINGKYCLKCGEPIADDYDFCYNCQDSDFVFDRSRSVFAYDDMTRPIIMRFKYNGLKTYAKPLGKMLADYFGSSDLIADVATFVPMPEKRKKKRGYNQAEVLCDEFCKLTGMPMVDALKRVKDIPRQSTLSGKERIENIKGNFAAADNSLVKDKSVLVIDDVVTTGATVNECAKALLKAGAREVMVLSLAKTVGENNKKLL